MGVLSMGLLPKLGAHGSEGCRSGQAFAFGDGGESAKRSTVLPMLLPHFGAFPGGCAIDPGGTRRAPRS